MLEAPNRLFTLLCLLAGVWIVVYWLWEPSPPKTTLDTRQPDPALVQKPVNAGQPPAPTPARVQPVNPPPRKVPPSQPEPTKKAEGPRVLEPLFRNYTIQRGDTIESIAERELRSRRYAGAIMRSNPLLSPDLLVPGKTIRIPLDPENIQGRLIEPPAPIPGASPGRAEAPAPATPPAPAAAAKGRKYTIQSDDTLWGIAKKFYGKGSMYKLIADANKDKIADPNDTLPVGVEIVIPDAP